MTIWGVNSKSIKEGILYKNIRVVEVGDGYLIGSRGYKFFRYDINKKRWHFYGAIADGKFAFLSRFRLLSRLFRADVHFFATLKNGLSICIAKKGVFLYNSKTRIFRKCFDIIRGARPLNICEDLDGNLYFGEYFYNSDREDVNIYKSVDSGMNWSVAYTFTEKSIQHIHGLHYDEFTGSIWVVTGDLDGECIIGYSDDEFRSFNIVFQGGQEYRTCKLLFFRDTILFGTDSETSVNYLKLINRKTLEIRDIAELQGSVITSVKIGEQCFLNTAVEPSEINTDVNSYVWMYDNETAECKIIAHFEKDVWDHRYFQFGWCRFPEYKDEKNPFLYFHGNALKRIDGSTVGMKISELRMKK